MLDVGWSELLLIGIVALIVVGPEDLPRMFHALGRITARARAMGREFSRAMEDAAKTSGLDEAAKTLHDVKSVTSKKALGLDALDRAAESFEKWDPKRPTPGPQKPVPAKPAEAPKPVDAAKPAEAVASVAAPATAPAPAPVPAEAAPVSVASAVAPAVTEAPGRRQLHASRRSGGDGA